MVKKPTAKKKVDPRVVTDPEVLAAAESLANEASSALASSLGTDTLFTEVTSVQWDLSDEEQAPPGKKAKAPPRQVAIAWGTWEHDGQFQEDILEGLSANADDVVVDLDSLLAGEGLGEEMDFLSGDTSPCSTKNPPEEVLEALADKLRSDWEGDLQYYCDNEQEARAIVE